MSRVTVNMNEILKTGLEEIAEKKNKSISKFVSEAIEHYILELKKRELGAKVLDLIGNTTIPKDTIENLHIHRDSDDRA